MRVPNYSQAKIPSNNTQVCYIGRKWLITPSSYPINHQLRDPLMHLECALWACTRNRLMLVKSYFNF